MLKRIIALFLVCILAIPIFTMPASALTSTQYNGILDAIDDLAAGLGTSQADIRDWLESIYYAITDWFQEWQSTVQANVDFIATELAELVDSTFPSMTSYLSTISSKIQGLYNYFFVLKSYQYPFPSKSGEQWVVSTRTVTLTGFEESLVRKDAMMALSQWYCDIANRLYTFLEGDTGKSDQFDSDMIPIETELDDMVDTMETAPTINLDDIENVFADDYNDQMDANYVSLLGQFISLEVVLTPLMISIVCAMLGYILFGKR